MSKKNPVSGCSEYGVVCLNLRLFRYGIYADFFLVFAHSFIAYDAVRQSKQGVVAADTDVRAGVDLRSSLTNENVTRKNFLTVAALRT